MKTLATIVLLIFWVNIYKAQIESTYYGYSPFNKSELDTIETKYASKVYVKLDKHRASSFRFYDNLYQEIHYTRKEVEKTNGGQYVISKKNILYLGTSKVPKWYSLKKYRKYFVSQEGLHSFNDKGDISPTPHYKYTSDERIYSAWNFNVLSNRYYYGKRRGYWNLETFGKENGGVGLYEFIENRYLELSNQYAPEYASLLSTSYAPIQNYNKEINNKVVQMKNDTSTLSLLAMFSTVIHESIHQKQYDLSTENYHGYYVPENEIKAKKCSTIFKSELLIKVDTTSAAYIFDAINFERILGYLYGHSLSNSYGIYGIMDEFSAYAHTANISLKLHQKLSPDSLSGFFLENDIEEIPNNFYCFNFMIAWYLEFAQKNYPDTYKELYSNKEFRKAYTLINAFFEQQLERYFKLEENETVKYKYKQLNRYKNLINAYESKKPLLDEFKI
ncbi:MAG: hypothetical protein KF732_03125 [Flavobacteriales bacterium]|nr:hypothetical protein [Flavobacteriales bacterium]